MAEFSGLVLWRSLRFLVDLSQEPRSQGERSLWIVQIVNGIIRKCPSGRSTILSDAIHHSSSQICMVHIILRLSYSPLSIDIVGLHIKSWHGLVWNVMDTLKRHNVYRTGSFICSSLLSAWRHWSDVVLGWPPRLWTSMELSQRKCIYSFYMSTQKADI